MKITLEWLKAHLDTDATVDDVVAALNRIGLEVEGVEDPAEKLAGFRVAKVLTAERHPQADKLQVLTVDAGDGAPLQVVCGAPNARAGLVGVLGLPGAVVPANGMELKISAIRGVTSNGMMCSTRELELGDDHDGIIELPADAPVGTAFADYSGAGDPVIDISITPNRQDCMGVRGIARDLAAAGLGTLIAPTVPEVAGEGPCFLAARALGAVHVARQAQHDALDLAIGDDLVQPVGIQSEFLAPDRLQRGRDGAHAVGHGNADGLLSEIQPDQRPEGGAGGGELFENVVNHSSTPARLAAASISLSAASFPAKACCASP